MVQSFISVAGDLDQSLVCLKHPPGCSQCCEPSPGGYNMPLPNDNADVNHCLNCRELWYRASLAWREILTSHESAQSTLLVAHNAVNQALVATAIGLPPTYFRRLLQNNAATTVLDFQPNKDGPPRVNVDRLNQVHLPSQTRTAANVSRVCTVHCWFGQGVCAKSSSPLQTRKAADVSRHF